LAERMKGCQVNPPVSRIKGIPTQIKSRVL
jgi:hypothetical protein